MFKYYDMGSDKCYEYTNTWEYDSNNVLQKRTHCYWGDNIFTYEYEYDGHGNLIKTSETFEGSDEMNGCVPGTVYSENRYVYDKSGNIRVKHKIASSLYLMVRKFYHCEDKSQRRKVSRVLFIKCSYLF